MSEPAASAHPPDRPPELYPSFAGRLLLAQRVGGVLTPLLTAMLAFLIGGLVVLFVAGKNPLGTYKAIFNGSGLNWLFPWETCSVRHPSDEVCTAATSLQQTLILFTILALTGLAVAFAFRCGLFNIGGQGQYIVGTVAAVQMGIWFEALPALPHIVLAVAAAAVAGALWAGIAGLLKATVGAHEVITTIMLNWIALWVGSYLVGFGGPLKDPAAGPVPVSREVSESATLPVFWGSPLLQGLHIGVFVALAALIVYRLVLTRTTLGYEVRAVGFNPQAAAYGGISVARSYFLAMAISGAFAGTAGAMDILGWQLRLDTTAVQSYSQIAFLGIAVALLGRNAAVGIFFAALVFGALRTGASTRNLDPEVFRPELAGNLTEIIQGLVVLFVGAELLVLYVWQSRRRLRRAKVRRAPA
ncbi:MAG: ABC transporter permease [Thermoleophilia bacterium]|nr:ABC transporter permease [Thermoleophilia bacterium]